MRISRGRTLAAAVAALTVALPAARAQVTKEVTQEPATAETPPAVVSEPGAQTADDLGTMPTAGFWEGGGVRITEGTVLHPDLEVATAYQSNVFYQDTSDGPAGPIAAAVGRFSVGAQYGTISQGRLAIESPGGDSPARLIFNTEAMLTWNQYFSSNDDVTRQSDLGIGLNASATFNPAGQLSFGVRDAFVRNVNPGQSLREDLDRDRNELSGNLSWKPGGGAIETYLNYTFIVDVFEQKVLLFENRISHIFALGAKYRWLPHTQFTLEANMGTVTPSTDLKSSSTPLHVWAGVSTLLSPVFGVIARAGYGNGFYASGENVSTYLALLELRWAPLPMLRTAVGYGHDFGDALVGNFFTDHTIFARAGWQLVERWQLRLSGELRFRSYGDIHDVAGLELCGDASCGKFRDDLLARVDASIEYQITQWLFAGIAYDLQMDRTDFFARSGSATDSGAYVANEVLFRVAARF